MRINFYCPCCGDGDRDPKYCQHIIEEVLMNVTQYSTVTNIEIDYIENYEGEKTEDFFAALGYGPTNTEDGEVSHYQCAICGNTLEGCHSPETLYKYLEENDMLEERYV